MGASLECCVRRGEGSSCCDLNSSILGEDAFYRDAFYDCEEGKKSDDWLFEQARLKMRKSSVLAGFASFELERQATKSASSVKDALSQCGQERKPRLVGVGRVASESSLFRAEGAWLDRTIPRWTGGGLPDAGEGPYWSRGDGSGLRVRCGPDYRRKALKKESDASPMYGAVCCDAIRAGAKIENIIGRHVDPRALPSMQQAPSGGDCSGGTCLQWSPGCPLPRILCINIMLPYEAGILPFRKDSGCSFVGFFEIKPETIKAAMGKDMPPHVRLFREFFEGPAGAPGGPRGDPNRSLAARIDPSKKRDQQSGLFKCIAKCVNPEDVSVPEIFNAYNGKPCLITKCGYVVKDPAGEWLELGIDVRGFNVMARRMLVSFRGMLPRTKIHYGFVIQGVEDEELPEGLLCDMFVHGIDMMESPQLVDDEIPPLVSRPAAR